MADKKITQLNNITGANLANTDEFVVVDVSADETMAVTREQFFLSVPAITATGSLTTAGSVTVSRASGYGSVEVGGPSGGLIDLKSPASDDYDARIIYNDGTDLQINTLSASDPILLRQGNSTKLATSSTGVNVTGNLMATGDVSIGDDLFLTGPTPTITLTDNDTVSEYTVLRNVSGNTYLETRNGTVDGQLIIRGLGGSVANEFARLNASGNFGIGNSAPAEKLDVVGNALISGNIVSGEGSGAVALTTNDGQGNANVTFNHANGIPDFLGNGARIVVNTDSTSAPNMIFELGSAVTAGVSYNTTEYMRVNTNGISVTGTVTATGGIYLGGTAAVNLLDDYEEGTWTPAISDGTNTGTASITAGSYTKTGNHVHVQGRVRLSSLGSVSGSIRLTGLPFASQAVTNNFSAMTIGRAAFLNLTAGTSVCGDLRNNVSQVLLEVWDAGAGVTAMQATEFSADGDIAFSMDYLSN